MKQYQLAIQIYRLGHLERILIDRELAPFNLRMNHARVLHYIYHHPGCVQKELANYLNYQPASLTNLINLLERRRMLVRKSDPNNGRQKRLYLLPNGKKIVNQTDAVFEKLNQLIGEADPQVTKVLASKLDQLEKLINS